MQSLETIQLETIQNAIGGRKVTSTSARTTAVFNPATGEQSAILPLSEIAEVNAAVAAAKQASVEWGNTPPMKRVKPMFKFKELLERHANDIARAISKEHGKTHADALGELLRGIDVVDFACGIPHLLKGEFSRNVGPDIDSWSDRQPLGVVAGITPFNFPAMVPMWMYPVAVACGNTFILKPSERDPSAVMLAWELFQEAGFPAGVLNVVHGDKTAVGRGVTKDEDEAVKWFRKAADQGDAAAQCNLGNMYAEGRGVTKDEAEAVKWFRKAAERGHSPAQFNLGASYLFGQGVIKDPVQAHIWFNVAGAAGDEEARKQLRLLEKEMTPEQKAEATKLARELFERLPRKK